MSSLSSDRSVLIQRLRQRERFQVKPASNVLQCCVFLSSPVLTLLSLLPPYTPIYIYRGTPAAPLLQVKALCREREINSQQLEK